MDRDKMNKSGARILVWGGRNIGQKFHILSLIKPLWRRQNFGSKKGTFSKNVLIKYF